MAKSNLIVFNSWDAPVWLEGHKDISYSERIGQFQWKQQVLNKTLFALNLNTIL